MRFAACAFAAALIALPAAAQERLLVLNKADHTMVSVDPATMKVTGTVAVGHGPHEVIASADGRTAFVANYGDQGVMGNSLSVVDLATMKETNRIDLGALRRPHGIAQAGGKVYFTSEASRAIARYDPAADRVDWIAGTGQTTTHMIVLSPDAKRLYTANIGSDTVTALSIPQNPKPIAQVKVGRQPEAIDISPDGKEVWVGQNGDGHVSVIDTADDTVKATFKVGQLPIRLKFTPDGKRVLVSDPPKNEVIVLDAATRQEVKRIAIDGAPLGIQMTPGGKVAYISRVQAGVVDALDLDKLEVVGSVSTGRAPDGLAYAVAK